MFIQFIVKQPFIYRLKRLCVVLRFTLRPIAHWRTVNQANTDNSSVSTLIAASAISAFGLSPSGGSEFGGYESVNSIFSAGSFIGPEDWEDEDAPKAFLNYILFDEDYIPYDFGFDQIDADALETGSNVTHDLLSLQALATKPGYIYIYLSNENDKIVDVYFDDFEVEHIKSPVIQTDDYYAFGLTFNSYERENSVKNQYLYNNGAERQDELDLNVDATKFRMYDPAMGRWWQIDPLADGGDLVTLTPYNYSFNNPIRYNDPNGDCPPGTPCGDVVKNPTISSDNGGKNNNRFRMGNRTKGHEGIDILASKGTGLQNVILGKVVYANNNHASDEYSGSRRVDANGKKVSKAPTTGLGNSLVIAHTLETDYTFQSAGKEVTLAKGMQVYIRYSHLDNVDESLLGKDVGVGIEIGKSGATGNPGLYQGKWGISEGNRHVHIEASTSEKFSNSSRIDPEAFMNTKYDKQGNAAKTEDSPKK